VTGAGSGIGRGAAQAFARRGARAVDTDLDEDRAKVVADELGETAIAVPCDVTRIEDLEATRSAAIGRDRLRSTDSAGSTSSTTTSAFWRSGLSSRSRSRAGSGWFRDASSAVAL
jgi:NAD(P)-dependent dehydrogenase (short-subunit alcohol dehydrogenase family)